MKITMTVIQMVNDNGGHVIALICDCLRTNIKFFSLFPGFNPERLWSVDHPLKESHRLYLLIDTVHILKSIRNNWITEKDQKLCLGDSSSPGDWHHTVNLYEAERFSLIKNTTLTRLAVSPSPMKRQSVSLVLKVVNDKTIAALRSFRDDSVKPTVNTLCYILEWWNTVNVKSVGEAQRFNDASRSAVLSPQCEAIDRLNKHATYFSQGSSNNGRRRVACLTIDTHRALYQTTMGLLHLSRDLLQQFDFSYVLLQAG